MPIVLTIHKKSDNLVFRLTAKGQKGEIQWGLKSESGTGKITGEH